MIRYSLFTLPLATTQPTLGPSKKDSVPVKYAEKDFRKLPKVRMDKDLDNMQHTERGDPRTFHDRGKNNTTRGEAQSGMKEEGKGT